MSIGFVVAAVLLALSLVLCLFVMLNLAMWMRKLDEAKRLLDRSWAAYQSGEGSKEEWEAAMEHSRWVRTRGREGRPVE